MKFIILSMLISVNVQAARSPQVVLKGKVKSFDLKTVTLEHKKQIYKVPRHYFPKEQEVIVGQNVELEVNLKAKQ